MTIKLSIIIVNYNTKKILSDCLRSVFNKVRNIEFEVWLVDNASSDRSVEMIKRKFPKIKIIANKSNLGFAKANNQAISKSKGEYVFLLNPDTILLDENLKQLIDFMDNHSRVGACGPLVLNKNLTMQRQCKRSFPTFWTSFSYYSGLWKLFPGNKWWEKHFGRYFLLNKPDDRICEVDQLSGAAIIVRKKTIDQIGLMNEKYIMYWDDTDWCFRIKKAGWEVYYIPLTKIIHYGGAGGAQLHALKNLLSFHRGACLFYKTYLAPEHFFLINWFYYTGVWMAFLLKSITNVFKREKTIGSKKPQ